VCFGQQHAHGIREVPDETWPEGVREAEPGDLDTVEQVPLIREQHAVAPVFSAKLHVEDPGAVRAAIEKEIGSDEIGTLLAEVDGWIVGGFVIAPVELAGDEVHGPRRPRSARAGLLPRLRRHASGGPRLGRRPGADAGGLRLVEEGGLRDDGHRLAGDEPALVALLAGARLPAQLLRLYRSIP
jgi:hypothetical protein